MATRRPVAACVGGHDAPIGAGEAQGSAAQRHVQLGHLRAEGCEGGGDGVELDLEEMWLWRIAGDAAIGSVAGGIAMEHIIRPENHQLGPLRAGLTLYARCELEKPACEIIGAGRALQRALQLRQVRGHGLGKLVEERGERARALKSGCRELGGCERKGRVHKERRVAALCILF